MLRAACLFGRRIGSHVSVGALLGRTALSTAPDSGLAETLTAQDKGSLLNHQPSPRPEIPSIKDAAEFAQVVSAPAAAVLFSASWSGPCRMLAPVLLSVVRAHNDALPPGARGAHVRLAAADIDALAPVAVRHGVTAVPHVVLFRAGTPVASFAGVQSAEYVGAFLREH